MFLHLGDGVSVLIRDIIYIHDFKQIEASEDNRRLWQRVRQERPLRDVAEGRPKSLVLTEDGIYLSAISSLTLKRRAELLAETGRED